MEEDTENIQSVEADNGQSFLENELEALQSIYINEVEVTHNENATFVFIDLHPATADKLEEQYVMMTLKFIVDAEYPQHVPEIHIRNPRGLSDEKLSSISQDLKSIAESKIGGEMLFEVIQAAKEHLTELNRPCGECAICLYSFSDEDVFTKTNCYHYFHSHCLATYAKASLLKKRDDEDAAEGKETPTNDLACPVCRLPIQFEGAESSFPLPSLQDEDIVIGEEVLYIQKKMADLYQQQVEKGGIIDLEAEKNKFLLEISDVPACAVEEALSSDLSKEENISAPIQSEDNSKSSSSPSKSVSSDDKKTSVQKFDKQLKKVHDSNQTVKNDIPKNNRSDNSKTQKDATSSKKTFDKEKISEDEDIVSQSQEKKPYRRNERRNNYGLPHRYYDDYNSHNNYRYPNSRGSYRGYRYPSNGYDRRNFQDRGYRGQGARPRYERKTSDEQNKQKDSEKESKFVDGAKETGELGNVHHSENSPTHDDGSHEQEPRPRDHQDRDHNQQQEGKKESKSSEGKGKRYSNRQPTGSNQERNYSHNKYSERDAHTQRRGSYGTRDSYRKGSYSRSKNPESYNSVDRQSSKEDSHDREPNREADNDYAVEDKSRKGFENQKNTFSDVRSSYRGNRYNRRGNGNYHGHSCEYSNGKKKDDSSNYPNNQDAGSEGHSDVNPLKDKNRTSEDNRPAEGKSTQRFPQKYVEEDNPQHYKDRKNYNSQPGGYRNPGGSRYNSDYDYRKNSRPTTNSRPYRNTGDSYQYRNNYRQYSSNLNSRKSNTSVQEANSASNHSQTSLNIDTSNATKLSLNDEKLPSNGTVNSHCSETPSNPPVQLAASNLNSTFATSSLKMPKPPPGFSNPLNKVVYGLSAANPPPGFSRN